MKAWPGFLVLLVACGCANHASAPGACELAQRYVAASNLAQPERVAASLDANVVAVFLANGTMPNETIVGRDDVLIAIERFSAQCPSCRSELICLAETERAAYTEERVRYRFEGGVERSQAAPLVVEIENGKITRITYYPAVLQGS